MGRLATFLFVALTVFAQVSVDPVKFPLVHRAFDGDPREVAFACDVRVLRPLLTYAFQFQSGWTIDVPRSNLRSEKHEVAVLARVIPEHASAPILYLFQQFEVPERSARKGDVILDGVFLMGPGVYTVELVMYDDERSACRDTWRVDARLKRADRNVVPDVPAWELRALEPGVWSRFAAARAAGRPRSGTLSVILNAAPFRRRASSVGGLEFGMMVSSVAALLRFTDFEQVRLTAYNLDQQKIIYRSDDFRPESIRDLARAIRQLNLATVPVDVVNRPAGHVEVLKELLAAEAHREFPSSAVLFLGPPVPFDGRWKQAGSVGMPVVYANFRPAWGAPSWNDPARVIRPPEFPDLIERITVANRGKVFRVHSPTDFARALAHLSGLR